MDDQRKQARAPWTTIMCASPCVTEYTVLHLAGAPVANLKVYLKGQLETRGSFGPRPFESFLWVVPNSFLAHVVPVKSLCHIGVAQACGYSRAVHAAGAHGPPAVVTVAAGSCAARSDRET